MKSDEGPDDLESSVLPTDPDPQSYEALNDLLIRLRLRSAWGTTI